MKDSINVNAGSYPGNGGSGDLEALRQTLVHSVPKFGNDIDEVDTLAREGALIYCREVEKYTNPRGGQFQAGLYPASINVLMGSHVRCNS